MRRLTPLSCVSRSADPRSVYRLLLLTALAMTLWGGLACSSDEASQDQRDTARQERASPRNGSGPNAGSATTVEGQPPVNRDRRSGGGDTNRGDKEVSSRGPASKYDLVEDPAGSLTIEVPPGWGVETGRDSEGEGGPNSWSSYAGEYLISSITTARSLDAWYGGGEEGSGAYVVASKSLAQDYTDEELIRSLLFEDKADKCTEGPFEDLERGPYNGKIQTWYECGPLGATSFVAAAAPEDRECVVVVGAKVVGNEDREAVRHLLDTFEVDCRTVTSEPLPDAPSSASASATTTPETTSSAPATSSPEAGDEAVSCDDFVTMFGEPSQYQAQQFYDFNATPEQQEILDPDGDGFACDAVEGDSDAIGEPDAGEDPGSTPPASPDPSSVSPETSSSVPPDGDSPPSSTPPVTNGDVNCGDVSPAQAQAILESDPTDPNDLDGDGDGTACNG